MPSLQSRDRPEPPHRWRQIHAQAHERSLGQQARADLETIAARDSRERRRQAEDRLAQRGPLSPSLAAALSGDQAPEASIRADRERCWN